ncbi:MAG: hypothetical protein F6K22_05130 [Okeania sp. SIO2F4]|uniref:hypothetical protein n=1 Tax=Okeania sp. SIO2F4 TaxID=2607790 RepID=UPI00142CF469|nr:hypothetical protein [Okeania sp. SIO2F4]NES02274.1 hypothetical protein [Okeania sp. SIO2F4]
MSKKRNKFLIINEENFKDAFLLRNEFHSALAKEKLVEEILLVDNEFIEIREEREKTPSLKLVKITELSYVDQKSKVEKIWRVNLEKQIPGISTSGKTTEVALLVLQKYLESDTYRLNIILIELKSSLQSRKTKSGKILSSSLEEIQEKFWDTMNRMYMLLTLNNHGNENRSYSHASIHIDFKAGVFLIEMKLKNMILKMNKFFTIFSKEKEIY